MFVNHGRCSIVAANRVLIHLLLGVALFPEGPTATPGISLSTGIRLAARFARKRDRNPRLRAIARGPIAGGERRLMNASRLFANLPNLITLARLLMTPLAVSMIVSQRF